MIVKIYKNCLWADKASVVGVLPHYLAVIWRLASLASLASFTFIELPLLRKKGPLAFQLKVYINLGVVPIFRSEDCRTAVLWDLGQVIDAACQNLYAAFQLSLKVVAFATVQIT